MMPCAMKVQVNNSGTQVNKSISWKLDNNYNIQILQNQSNPYKIQDFVYQIVHK
jgi:hypothetical protein